MPEYFNSRSATPWKTKQNVYRGGGVVKNGRGMGVALRGGGRVKSRGCAKRGFGKEVR